MTKPVAAATIAALGLALAAFASAGSASPRRPAACTPVSNIEAIVDDSGSMGDNDQEGLRVIALDLLIDKPQNATRTLGAIEFGTAADTVFRPELIATGAMRMKAALDARIGYDDLFTNYNAAFAGAKKENPGAGAWIFLTDGIHDIHKYRDGHRGGPPTYVIGLGIGAPGADANANRLQRIATETGGTYYAAVDPGSLRGVVDDIEAKLTCLPGP